MPMTNEQMQALEEIASKVYDGELRGTEGADLLAQEYDINHASAVMYIQNYRKMIEGQVLKRGLRVAVADYFLTKILEKRGRTAHSQALEALEKHIDYREGLNQSEMHAMREVLSKHLNLYN